MGMPCCFRGYHVYKEVWDAAIGEVLECHREPTKATDRYAVAVTKAATISGDLLDLNKNFRCIIIFVQKIFVHFQRTKIFLRRKKQMMVCRHTCTNANIK